MDGYVGCDELPDLSYLDVVEYDGNDEYDDGVGVDEFREAEYSLETDEKLSGGGRAEDESDTQRMENVLEATEITTGEDTTDVSVLNVEAGTYAYKNVTNRTKLVATILPEEFRTKCKIPGDPLLDLPELPTKSPPFTPGECYTQERKDSMEIIEDNFLTQDEDLTHSIIRENVHVFAWDESEKIKFSKESFEPVVIPTIPMGSTNSTRICHGDTSFILEDEIPHVNVPSIDNIPIKGPETRFEQDGTYETIPDKPSIHLCDDLRTVHRRVKATAVQVMTAPDVQMGVEKAPIVGHLCSYRGREPDVKCSEKPRFASIEVG